MDDLANTYWTAIFIFIIFIFIRIVSLSLGVIHLIKRNKRKKITLGSSVKVVFIAYIVLAITFYFIPGGKIVSFFFLPIFSVFTLICLELFKLIKH